jgi:UDP-2-acetamido-3-amino-2,3-dideoxy-glucuronate N-acetyltransferase
VKAINTIYPTPEVSARATVAPGAHTWHYVQVREGASIEQNCIIGQGTCVDFDVSLGNDFKVQHGAFLYHGLTVEDAAFIGPGACNTNDVHPRAITPEGVLKTVDDWAVGPTRLCYGTSAEVQAVILQNMTVGRFAMVAAGAVANRSVPDYGLVVGVPARPVGYACACGQRLEQCPDGWRCLACGQVVALTPEPA